MIADVLVKAEGWSRFDEAPKDKDNQDHLDFAHKVANVFKTSEGQEVLEAMVKKYLIASFSNDNDPHSLIRKQGRADVVKQILAQIETSNNS